MKVIENVQSTVKPKEVEFDQFHVYVNTNIKEVPDEERPYGVFSTLYSYKVTEYEKDEFLSALSLGQVTINNKTSALEEMVLDMSTVVYY